MAALLRLVELLIQLLLVAWAVLFPIAMLVSLALALPLLAFLGPRPAPAERRLRRVQHRVRG